MFNLSGKLHYAFQYPLPRRNIKQKTDRIFYSVRYVLFLIFFFVEEEMGI